MPSVIFDYTRVISALGQSPGRPHLTLSDLAKVVEAIVLCDSIFTTEDVPFEYERRGTIGRTGFFDLSKKYIYGPIFTDIFEKVPSDVDERVGIEHQRFPRLDYRELSFLKADLAILEEAKSVAVSEEFQFLSQTTFSEQGVLSTLERIRVLTSIAGDLGTPYDPISFRVPLVGLSIPGNLEAEHLRPFRRFEHGVQTYIEELIHDRLGFQFPLMLAIILRECRAGAPDDVFATALQLRSDPMLQRFRHLLDVHVTAYRDVDLGTVAKMDRVIKAELASIKAHFSGELPAEFKLSLKPSWFPLTIGWKIKPVLQHFRDRRQWLPLANLSRLSKEALLNLGSVRSKLGSVLPIELRDSPSQHK